MKIIVTDLTRFNNNDIVCLAGINPESGECIRPMQDNNGRLEYFSFDAIKKSKVIPGSILEGDFRPCTNLEPPHTEDHRAIGRISVAGNATGTEFENILEESAFQSIADGFESHPDGKLFRQPQYPQTSIITLALRDPANQFKLTSSSDFGKHSFKAHITDGTGLKVEWVPVTDLGFFVHLKDIIDSDRDLKKLNNFLWTQETLYLRIGLSRPWGMCPEKYGCWLQLNGIYSFPNFRRDIRVYE